MLPKNPKGKQGLALNSNSSDDNESFQSYTWNTVVPLGCPQIEGKTDTKKDTNDKKDQIRETIPRNLLFNSIEINERDDSRIQKDKEESIEIHNVTSGEAMIMQKIREGNGQINAHISIPTCETRTLNSGANVSGQRSVQSNDENGEIELHNPYPNGRRNQDNNRRDEGIHQENDLAFTQEDELTQEEFNSITYSDDNNGETGPPGEVLLRITQKDDRNAIEKIEDAYGDKTLGNEKDAEIRRREQNEIWFLRWTNIVGLIPRRYKTPKGRIGKKFIEVMTKEVRSITLGKNVSEKLLFFQASILQKSTDVTRAGDIRKRIENRLSAWAREEYEWLEISTIKDSDGFKSNKKKEEKDEETSKTFNRMVMEGRMRAAIRWATERENGGPLMSHDWDPKGERSVFETLKILHPDRKVPEPDDLCDYGEMPPMGKLEIPSDTVEVVAHHLKGSGGPSGTDGASMKKWILHFGPVSRKLQKEITNLIEWIGNEKVPWEAIKGLMASRLVALDKSPGVRPIGVGEIWRRLLAKVVLRVTGKEATDACGSDQLCAGVEGGIEAGVRAASRIIRDYGDDDDWGYLTIDARNAFNEVNRLQMLWSVRKYWPSAARFVFNCYKGNSRLVIREMRKNKPIFLHSKE